MDWYSVKLLYQYTVTGEPDPILTDEFFHGRTEFYEERIVLVSAGSYEDAFQAAEDSGPAEEYTNKYGQKVTIEFYDAIDCFRFYEQPRTRTEVYSAIFSDDAHVGMESLIDRRYGRCTAEEMHVLRHQ